MPIHVPLDRTFLPLGDEDEFDSDAPSFRPLFGVAGQSWDELLKKPRVVILAEAGTGKTYELRAKAKGLRDDGHAAFFCPIEQLAADAWPEALDLDDGERFQTWRDASTKGWFFLDSVDEARLVNFGSFERALRHFSRGLANDADRAFVYVTARVSDWRADADLEIMNQMLPPPKMHRESVDQHDTSTSSGTSRTLEVKQSEEEKSAAIVQLAPLSLKQMRTFAETQGVEDVDEFMAAIEEAEAEAFAERTQDLLELISFWKRDGRFGSHEQMVDRDVQIKLQESDPGRDQIRPLSPERARYGAEVLAAAATLCKKTAFILPDRPVDPGRAAQSIDPQQILPTFDALKLQALLGRAVFDEATYGRVRFHHRSIREYLMAQWVNRLLNGFGSRRSVEQLIFRQVYGVDVIVPSMRPVAAWLALWDGRIQEQLLAKAPEVLVEGGDASRLPLTVREMLLRYYSERVAQETGYDASFDRASVRRLADPHLAGVIVELLERYRDNDEVRTFLLRLVWHGEIAGCADLALSFAIDTDMSPYTRVCAIHAVAQTGNTDLKRQLAAEILSGLDTWATRPLATACVELFPTFLSIEEIVTVLARVEPPSRWSAGGWSDALEEIVQKEMTTDQRRQLLASLNELLECEPYVDERHSRISSRYSWLLPAVKTLVENILESEREEPPGIDTIRAIELIGIGRDHGLAERIRGDRLNELVSARYNINHTMFWRSVERRRSELNATGERLTQMHQAYHVGMMWSLAESDFDLFLRDICERELLDDRLVALTAAFAIRRQYGRTPQTRTALRRAVQGVPELELKLRSLFHPPHPSPAVRAHVRSEQAFRRRQREREREETEAREAFVRRIQERTVQLQEITSDNVDRIFPDLYQLTRRISSLADNNTRWGVSDWRLLESELGPDAALGARDGLMAFWRLYCPPPRFERATGEPIQIPIGVTVGLTGLAIESTVRPDWTARLSRDDAMLAARYATLEMNGFPDWTPDLFAAWPEVVDEVFGEELDWEFEVTPDSPEPHHVLSGLVYGCEHLRQHFGCRVLELLSGREPSHGNTLENSLTVLLSSRETDVGAMASLATERYAVASDQGRRLTWLVAWFYVEADAALDALRIWISEASSPDEADGRVIRFCNALMDHRNVRFRSTWRDFERIEVLRELVPLVHEHIRVEDDPTHEGIYTPDERDNASHTRGYLLQILYEIPGRATYDALIYLSGTLTNSEMRSRTAELAGKRSANDGEPSAWQPQDVAEFAANAERQPCSARDLFELTVNRLDDLKLELEEGDTSEASLLRRAGDESEVRTWFASRLRTRSRGQYAVPPEEELADRSRPDLRIHNPNINAPVPIELKIADNWSYSELSERLRNQLVGQYLRDDRSRYGVFLMTWHGGERWRYQNQVPVLTFEQLVARLQQEADEIAERDPNVESLAVVGINLMRRDSGTGSNRP